MNITTRYLLFPTAISLFVLGAIVTQAQAATLTVNFNSAPPIADNQAQTVSSSIGTVMQGIAKARDDLKAKNGTDAKNELIAAQNALKTVKDSYGNGIASVNLSTVNRGSKLSFMDAAREPGMPNLGLLSQAKLDLKHGQMDSARKNVDAVDFALVFAEIDVPIGQTDANLSRAITFIDQNKLDQADATLNMAQLETETSSGLFSGDF